MRKITGQRSMPRYLTLFAVLSVLLTTLFLPTLIRHESALHIRASHQGGALPDGFFVYQRLSAEGIHFKSITLDNNALIIKFDTSKQSTAAEKVLRELLPFDFDIAPDKEFSSSGWLSRFCFYNQIIG